MRGTCLVAVNGRLSVDQAPRSLLIHQRVDADYAASWRSTEDRGDTGGGSCEIEEGAEREWVTTEQLHLWVMQEVGLRMGIPFASSIGDCFGLLHDGSVIVCARSSGYKI
jgi:hypothetical protein